MNRTLDTTESNTVWVVVCYHHPEAIVVFDNRPAAQTYYDYLAGLYVDYHPEIVKCPLCSKLTIIKE